MEWNFTQDQILNALFSVSNDGVIYDSPDGQLEEIKSIFRVNQPAVWIRHYAFLNFDSLGFSRWKPDWINIVRNPIERVRKLNQKSIC